MLFLSHIFNNLNPTFEGVFNKDTCLFAVAYLASMLNIANMFLANICCNMLQIFPLLPSSAPLFAGDAAQTLLKSAEFASF